MDSELTSTRVEAQPSILQFAMRSSGGTEASAPIATANGSAVAVLRRTRIALAEYARTCGVYDPIDVLTFTQSCIEAAAERVSANKLSAPDALLVEAFKIASVSSGIRCAKENISMNHQPEANAEDKRIALATTEVFVTVAADHKEVVPVPALRERVMPPQPLGELPDVDPAALSRSFIQMIRRAASSLVTSMFARGE